MSDSLSWLRFARIPIGGSAPHPSTLMKITTRCGPELIEELNATLIAKAVDVGVVDMGWLRADTTVVPADIKYPTDSGLLLLGAPQTTQRRSDPPFSRRARSRGTSPENPRKPRQGLLLQDEVASGASR